MSAGSVSRGEAPTPPEDASLNEALDDLETMLERRGGPASAGDSSSSPPADPVPAGAEQYTIPLLDDVVVPGDVRSFGEPRAERWPGTEDPQLSQQVAERLASEIEVIMNTRLEQVLAAASEDIRGQIRNHIEIVLPEILEELALERRRPRADGTRDP